MLFLILILIFVVLLVVVTNIVIVPQSMVWVAQRAFQSTPSSRTRPAASAETGVSTTASRDRPPGGSLNERSVPMPIMLFLILILIFVVLLVVGSRRPALSG